MAIFERSYTLVGVFGGTFNPIHLGHLNAAKEILDIVGMIRMLLIPSAQPPHRDLPTVSAEDRFNMLSIAVEDDAKLFADDIELRRLGPSFSFDTLCELRASLGENQALCFLLGQDAFESFSRWHRWDEFLDVCHLVIAQRPGYARNCPDELVKVIEQSVVLDAEELKKYPNGKVFFVDQTPLEASSTKIRAQIEQGCSSELLLPVGVRNYIELHNLYLNE